VPVFEARDVFVSFATVEEAGVISEDILPEKFAVYDNYPNPFNPTTQISFDLTENSVTEVSVWNLLGQKITTLYTGDLNAGHHTVKFDGKDSNGSILPSGVYIYRVAAGNNVSTKKMMLLK
jgi:flagellar hook assembly protein FlgD